MHARLQLIRALTVAVVLVAASFTTSPAVRAQSEPRPMTFLDMRELKTISSPTPSPDGRLLLYVLSTPDWKEAKSQTDLYLVSIRDGVSSTRQMTFTKTKNESSPRWSRDGRAFLDRKSVV